MKYNKYVGVKYGFYSEKQRAVAGTATYLTPSGKTVEITEVNSDPDYYLRQNWDDMIPVGEVTTCISSSKTLHQMFDDMIYEYYASSPKITYDKVQEVDCRTCSKKNDIGVKVCWNCGGVP